MPPNTRSAQWSLGSPPLPRTRRPPRRPATVRAWRRVHGLLPPPRVRMARGSRRWSGRRGGRLRGRRGRRRRGSWTCVRAWARRAETMGMGTPASSISVAMKCRRSWRWKCPAPMRRRASMNSTGKVPKAPSWRRGHGPTVRPGTPGHRRIAWAVCGRRRRSVPPPPRRTLGQGWSARSVP